MTVKLASWAAGAALAAFATGASATILDVTYSGTVSSGTDFLGLFGGGSLAGDAFSVSYSFDTTKGALSIVGTGYSLSGGSSLAGPSPSAGPATVTINGHSVSFSGGIDDYLGVDQSGMLTLMNDVPPTGPLTSSFYEVENSVAGYTLPFAPATNMTTPFSASGNSHAAFFGVLGPSGVEENILFSSAATTQVTLSVPGAAVPEPMAWITMLIGLGAIGVGTRQRKRRPEAAAC